MATTGKSEKWYQDEKCYACGRKLGNDPGANRAITSDGSVVYVGSGCAKLIERAGVEGYQPAQGGPRLYHTCGLLTEVGPAALIEAAESEIEALVIEDHNSSYQIAYNIVQLLLGKIRGQA